jgi:hypothetical protein
MRDFQDSDDSGRPKPPWPGSAKLKRIAGNFARSWLRPSSFFIIGRTPTLPGLGNRGGRDFSHRGPVLSGGLLAPR